MGKYDPLRDYLARRSGDEVKMAFADVERLVGTLPTSARNHRAWWADDSKVEARAWRAAGWRVQSVNQTTEFVVFARGDKQRAPVGGPPVEDERRAHGAGPGHLVAGTPQLPLPTGFLFAGRYRVKGRLGGGERKQTYLAWDTKTPRDVALAVVAKDADPEVTKHEVEILGRVTGGPKHRPFYRLGSNRRRGVSGL
jgi:hypothetical protein